MIRVVDSSDEGQSIVVEEVRTWGLPVMLIADKPFTAWQNLNPGQKFPDEPRNFSRAHFVESFLPTDSRHLVIFYQFTTLQNGYKRGQDWRQKEGECS